MQEAEIKYRQVTVRGIDSKLWAELEQECVRCRGKIKGAIGAMLNEAIAQYLKKEAEAVKKAKPPATLSREQIQRAIFARKTVFDRCEYIASILRQHYPDLWQLDWDKVESPVKRLLTVWVSPDERVVKRYLYTIFTIHERDMEQ
jgi:hypothetical protein